LLSWPLRQAVLEVLACENFLNQAPARPPEAPLDCFFASTEFNLRASSSSVLFRKAGKQFMLGVLHFLRRSKVSLLLCLSQ
jgi:hypothetical protein